MTAARHRPASPGPAERLLRHDSAILITAICVIFGLAAIYTVLGVGMEMSAVDMTRMAGPIGEPMAMAPGANWTWGYAFLVFLMWWIMMIAMMTPSAAPVLLLFTALKRQGSQKAKAASLSATFLMGYLFMWMGFSAAATFLQWLTVNLAVTSGPMMTLSSKPVAGLVMMVAGLYQVSNLKAACLSHCRSPAHFLAAHNRKGYSGAFQMGLHHGAFCLGCCWALMALLFVGGIMNLYWIVGLAIYVLVEKFVPYQRLFSLVSGSILVGAGTWFLVSAL